MSSISTIMDFLASLFSNEDTQAAFDQDPRGTLARHGLGNVSGQDIRDARLIMADNGGVCAKPGHTPGGSGSDDPVREIHHTRHNYEPGPGGHHAPAGDTFNITNIDDRDTLNIEDSFNKEVTVVDDSFNSDNDISESVVAGEDISGPVDVENADSTKVVAVNDSFNEETNNDVDVLEIEDSFNEEPEAVHEPAPEPEPELEPEPDLDPDPEPAVA